MTKKHVHRRGAKWLPANSDVHAAWLSTLIREVRDSSRPLHAVIESFREFIEEDAEAYMLFNDMFAQARTRPNSVKAPSSKVRDYGMMLNLFNALLTRAPTFDRSGVVGSPFTAVIDAAMGTPAGFTAFLHARVNEHLRAILNEWGRFLRTADSCSVLNDDPEHGWFGESAMAEMPGFAREFVCDPGKPHMGFTSWDDFFTRKFREGVRPIAEPHNDRVIINPCEAAPYRVARDVKERDRFWIKGQRYSLHHMLAGDTFTPQFVGGTIYQAYLSALSYHRWHSPVSGRIMKAYLQPGTYFSETLAEASDPAGPTDSQGYITEVATRALIFIEADDPSIGLLCFMPVGMGEVSTCEITVYEGQHVSKGDELGMFHFGGSTVCLLFRPEAKVRFNLHGEKPGLDASNIPVRSALASVRAT